MSALTWQNYSPEKLLAERFHITTNFHGEQREIIEQLVQGQRVLAIQRTGWGKSLCYQMASLYYPHLTIVFSPLKALMRDQCRRCNTTYSIPAAIISSDFTGEQNKATLEQAVACQFKILFIAPERLSNALWQSYVTQLRISMIVIDEAHCISTWGHDFRPHYRRIVRLLNTLPHQLPVLALTATANKRVEADILQQIGTTAQVIRGTLQRPNLHLQVVHLNGDQEKLGYLFLLISSPDSITYQGFPFQAKSYTITMSVLNIHSLRQKRLVVRFHFIWLSLDRHSTFLCVKSHRWEIDVQAYMILLACSLARKLGAHPVGCSVPGDSHPELRFLAYWLT